MHILYLLFHGFDSSSGISKKIFAQITGLKESGHEVSLCYYDVLEDGDKVRVYDKQIISNYGTGKWGALRSRFDFNSIIHHIDLLAKEKNSPIDVCYIRSFHNANPGTINLVKKLKAKKIKVIMEIPTYPYDNEYRDPPLSVSIGLLIDRVYRHRLAKTIDAFVTFSDCDTIFGQKTIRISNGISFNKIPLTTHIKNQSKEIHLLAVAEVHFWHGIDRALSGLGIYYQNILNQTANGPDVYFDIVGPISDIDLRQFQDMVSKYNIEKYIIFHGSLHGEKLDNLFNQTDIAIASLGRHRSKISHIKTLKNREYAARGIPFVYSEIDTDFEDKSYIIKAPADETPLDINALLKFYTHLEITPQEIRDTVKNLDWKIQMQHVIEKISE
ncbi:MAG: glycosyltransferase family 1 protein [Bacteroidaceae bacterium]